jgi:hypothetical protein
MLRMSLSALLMIVMTASYFAVFTTPAVASQNPGIENAVMTAPSDRSLSVELGPTQLTGIGASDVWGDWSCAYSYFTVNSVFENFTAEWVIPYNGLIVPDGTTVPTTSMTIRGFTDSFATVVASSQWDTISAVANDTGYYELYPVNIDDGLNIVTVTTTNGGGATASMLKIITVDRYCALIVFGTPDVTDDPNLVIVGLTEPGATVFVNEVGFLADPDGTLEAYVTLSEGPNTICVNASDAVGNTNNVIIEVVLDTIPPNLVITGPADGSNVSEPSVLVYGTTETGAAIRVNGVVASDGSANWAATVVLSEGMNTVVVAAEDVVGNSLLMTVSVEYIPPDYVTPEELAAIQEDLLSLIENLSASLTDNVSALQGQIDSLISALAENISALQADMDGLESALTENISALQGLIDDLVADVSDLQTALAENLTALETADNQLAADLRASVTALIAAIASNVSALQTDLAAKAADLQAQIDSVETGMALMNTSVQDDLTDMQDRIEELNQSTQDDIGAVEDQAKDIDAFAGMLLYLTLALFAIAIILVAIVWYVMNGKVGGGSPGGSGQSLEEVDESPSEVEREFEQLEKEIKAEEK